MKVIILGKGDMLANLIKGTLLSGNEIVGIFRYENLFLKGIRRIINDCFNSSTELTLIKKYKLHDIKFKSANSEDFKREVLRLNADIILVGTWAEKLNPEIINTPKIATINVHPSLLPKYRGPNPYLQTIWHKEKFSGITFHLMTEKLDAGPILAQAKIELLQDDTGKELRDKTVFKAGLLCEELLSQLKNVCVEPIAQDESVSSYFKEIEPNSMTLDFAKETASDIYAHVKAFHPFRPTYIQDNKNFWIVNPYKIKILNNVAEPNTITLRRKNSLTVAAKDGKLVQFDNLKKYNKFLHKLSQLICKVL